MAIDSDWGLHGQVAEASNFKSLALMTTVGLNTIRDSVKMVSRLLTKDWWFYLGVWSTA
jgi:hypothetical protein